MFCYLLWKIYPDLVQVQKVNKQARTQFECRNNYKILALAFFRARIEKNLNVENLIKGKPQELLEFLQWFKRFADLERGKALKKEKAERIEKL
mmetsp:Transcript_16098/g.11615  ORF Transcript_16098/g.11615 Transcript_16098/m.11615 type:complete len:93 (+) Transcript_16098:123-401(+)